jgi:hypothetical protein
MEYRTRIVNGPDRKIRLDLPVDFPEGPAEVVVIPSAAAALTDSRESNGRDSRMFRPERLESEIAWDAELARRAREALRGENLVDAEEVFAKVRAQLGVEAVDEDEGEEPGITDFDCWVAENNVPGTLTYAGAWWHFVEIVRQLASRVNAETVRVVGTFTVNTPPPQEKLPMPAVALGRPGILVALAWDFGRVRNWPNEWMISVRRSSPYRGPTFGLFDLERDLRTDGEIEGLSPHHLFGSYRLDPAQFTCEVNDEWDVAMLLTMLFHEV